MIFSVGAKLLGVYFVYLGLMYLLNATVYGDGRDDAALIQLLHAGLALVFALVLMLRTDWLGQIIGVNAEASTSFGASGPRAALRTGIVLVGLYVFLIRLGSVLLMVSMRLGGVRFDSIGGAALRILIESVPLALAVVFVFRADRVIDLIDRENEPAG